MKDYHRLDHLDPLPMDCEWPSLRASSGRVDIHTLAAFFVRENKLSGAYFEFGVAGGRSAISAIRANRRENPSRVAPFLLFDSFQGQPTLIGPNESQLPEDNFTFGVESVIKNLKEYGVYDNKTVYLVPGWFERTLPNFPAAAPNIGPAAIVHIDVDLYPSCVAVLDFIAPYLQVGTVILFDDWNAVSGSRSKSERAATAQWLKKNAQWELNDFALYGLHGRAFIVDATLASHGARPEKPAAVITAKE
jgi:O-methyltransferase